MNSNSNGISSTGVEITTKTRRPQPRSNTKNDMVSFMSKSSCIKNKEVENDKSEVVCAMCKQCLITTDHDVCVLNYVNGMNSFGDKLSANISKVANQKKHKPEVKKPKKVRLSKFGLWCVDSVVPAYVPVSKLLINFVWKFLGTVRFINDHVVAILEGVDLLKGNRTTNLYTINLYEMASTSPICLIARGATSTKSWLWHQRLSYLNFDTINDLAKNDLITGLSKFKYHKEHLCPSYEQGKRKKASHPPKPIPNYKQRLHLLHMDLCCLLRVESINRKRYVLVIVDDYSRYTWVHFLISKDEAPEEIKTFLKKIIVLEQAPVIIVRIDNDTTFKNQMLKEYFDSVGISHQSSSVRIPQQNGVVERRN
ncbi:retrovirus-related pol polyprotein from transposon TNT 1-94 [Tanacetum coccineum]